MATSELEIATAVVSPSLWERSINAGPMVFLILVILCVMSVFTWAIFVMRWLHLRRIELKAEAFTRHFLESRSLQQLERDLDMLPYSPSREIFRAGYAELGRNKILDGGADRGLALATFTANLQRNLQQNKLQQRRILERFQSFLAISASACPFIGLFGTVWGIMNAFEGIARSGSTSLATVAPGISEALTATAFGLAAAIPAVVGYNIANNKIRAIMVHVDAFVSHFINLVARHFVTRGQRPPAQDN